ncbi:substrate-binding domain-containing protein [Glutamicibacter arilaitensis]|uniref:substrate-binding domain-containing protein n=1 Tax=Glutamicibacter TaxID=1742989 RepID=UPI003F8FEAF3
MTKNSSSAKGSAARLVWCGGGKLRPSISAGRAPGISDVARHRDYHVVLANTGESLQDEEKTVRMLLDKRVDGLLICPTSRSAYSHILDAERAGRPVVLFDRDILVPALDVVQMSIAEVTSQVIDSLIDAGHRRIAYISTLKLSTRKFVPGQEIDLSTVTQRVAGICLALKRAEIEVDPELFCFGATDSSYRSLDSRR